MTETAQNLFMALGAALILVGVLVLVFKPAASENSVKLFGQEVRISAPGLVVIVLGCVMFAAPFLIPLRPGAPQAPGPAIKQADIAAKPDLALNQNTAPKPDVAPQQEVPKQDVAPKQDVTPKQSVTQKQDVAPPKKPATESKPAVSNTQVAMADTPPATSQPAPEPPPATTQPTSEPKPQPADMTASPVPAHDGNSQINRMKATSPILSALLGAISESHNKPRCKSGFVWREARPTDYVCVPPASRNRTAQENASAASRVDPTGAYGAASCRSGYVWREAYSGDVVCVAPATRNQVRMENRLGPGRTEP